MRVKFISGDLNPISCPLHSTITYTCRVTITPRVCGDKFFYLLNGGVYG